MLPVVIDSRIEDTPALSSLEESTEISEVEKEKFPINIYCIINII